MPIYAYKCLQCDNTFDKILKMDERKTPEETPCESCGGEIKLSINFAPSFCYTVGQSLKHSEGFNDRLKEIKSSVGRTVISKNLNDCIR